MLKLILFFSILLAGSAAQGQQGLCPGNPLASAIYSYPLVVNDRGDFVSRLKRDNHHVLAMQASAAIYDYGNLESFFDTGKNLFDGLKSFLVNLPKDYEIFRISVHPESGLKYMILTPKAGQPGPWILAIAGTQTILDWLMDLDLGRFQLDKLAPLFDLFTTCNQMGPDRRPMAAHDFIITGHSLGGGLAQAFSYRMQQERSMARLMPLRMELVTFNGFGAKPLVEKWSKYDSRFEESLNATNYFVKGDVVSRIGVHIGETRELTPREANPSIARRHKMGIIQEIAKNETVILSGLSNAVVKSPTEFSFLRELMGLGVIGQVLGKGGYTWHKAMHIVTVLQEASLLVEQEGNPILTNLMIRLVEERLIEIDRPSNGPLANIQVEDLTRLLKRLKSIRQ